VDRPEGLRMKILVQFSAETGYECGDVLLFSVDDPWRMACAVWGKSDGSAPFRMSSTAVLTGLRVPMGYVFALLYLVVARPVSLELFGVSAGFVVAGCALRSWAAGYLRKGRCVTVGGPYAFIRNPLYAGSFLIGVGFCVALWRSPLPLTTVVLWVIFLGAFLAVYPVKVRAEEKELLGCFGETYANYARKVPPFLPWRGRARDLEVQTFSAKVYFENREYQCLLGAYGVLALLFLRYLLGW